MLKSEAIPGANTHEIAYTVATVLFSAGHKVLCIGIL